MSNSRFGLKKQPSKRAKFLLFSFFFLLRLVSHIIINLYKETNKEFNGFTLTTERLQQLEEEVFELAGEVLELREQGWLKRNLVTLGRSILKLGFGTEIATSIKKAYTKYLTPQNVCFALCNEQFFFF